MNGRRLTSILSSEETGIHEEALINPVKNCSVREFHWMSLDIVRLFPKLKSRLSLVSFIAKGMKQQLKAKAAVFLVHKIKVPERIRKSMPCVFICGSGIRISNQFVHICRVQSSF